MKKPIYFKTISEDIISIREIDDNDVEELSDLFSKESVCKYLCINTILDKSIIKAMINRIQNEYKKEQIFYLGISLNENDKIIGYIGLSKHDLSEKTCQVVYALNENYWYKGIMVRALKSFVQYLLTEQKKELIIGTHITENNRSGKVMEKAGFIRDRDYDRLMILNGVNQNVIGYTIKKENIK